MKKKETFTTMDELMPLIQESLSAGQSVRFSPRGTSMLPMLRQETDSVVLSPVPEKLSRFDLPLYRRDDGKYILHRIVEVAESAHLLEDTSACGSISPYTYTCMGDNQFVKEPGVRHDQMIAVVTSFYRGGKEHKTTELTYRLYCRLWHHSHPLRHFLKRAFGWLKRHLKRIF